jgi:hypothetical protein
MAGYVAALRSELWVQRESRQEEDCESERAQIRQQEDAPKNADKGVRVRPACERCGQNERVPDERYCAQCRKAVLHELTEAGYFTPPPAKRRSEEKGRRPIRSSEWFSHQPEEDDYGEESEP